MKYSKTFFLSIYSNYKKGILRVLGHPLSLCTLHVVVNPYSSRYYPLYVCSIAYLTPFSVYTEVLLRYYQSKGHEW